MKKQPGRPVRAATAWDGRRIELNASWLQTEAAWLKHESKTARINYAKRLEAVQAIMGIEFGPTECDIFRSIWRRYNARGVRSTTLADYMRRELDAATWRADFRKMRP